MPSLRYPLFRQPTQPFGDKIKTNWDKNNSWEYGYEHYFAFYIFKCGWNEGISDNICDTREGWIEIYASFERFEPKYRSVITIVSYTVKCPGTHRIFYQNRVLAQRHATRRLLAERFSPLPRFFLLRSKNEMCQIVQNGPMQSFTAVRLDFGG